MCAVRTHSLITKCKYLLVSDQQTSIITPNAEIAFEICKFSCDESCPFGPTAHVCTRKMFSDTFPSHSRSPFPSPSQPPHPPPHTLPSPPVLSKHCVVHGSCNTIRSPTLGDDASLLELSLFCGLNRDIIKFCVHPNRYTIKNTDTNWCIQKVNVVQMYFIMAKRNCASRGIALRSSNNNNNNNTENVVKLNAMRCFYLLHYYHITNCTHAHCPTKYE